MAMMKWTKPSAKTIAYFERLAPGPPIQSRSMFGMPGRFLNGHMLVCVFQNSLMLHLSASDRLECIAAGAKPFAPLGREAKAYVDIAPGLFDDRTLKEWIVRGMRYLGSLPPKLKAPKRKSSVPPDVAPRSQRSVPPRSRRSVPQEPSRPTKAAKAAKAPPKPTKRAAAAKPSKAKRAVAPPKRKPGVAKRVVAKRAAKPTKRKQPKKKRN